MNRLRQIVNNIKPTFDEGGKFSWLKSTFGAFETFLFTPNTTTKRGSHIRDAVDLKRTMIIVVIALLPALLFGMWNIGYQTALNDMSWNIDSSVWYMLWSCFWFGFLRMLPLIVVSYVVGLGIEFMFAQIRHHEVNEGFLVTGLIIPMIVPVTTPLWQLALAVAFAVVIGKEVFGGTGMNIFNPALIARAFLFFAYPTKMSGDSVWVSKDQFLGLGHQVADTFTCATPLGQLAAELGLKTDAAKWTRRGETLFDSIWPLEFQSIDSTYTRMKGNGLYQGTRWQYRWGAPMYLGRMEKFVGKKTLVRELTTFFDKELYNQGNEPDIHVPFLFGRLGMMQKTGEVVRQLATQAVTHRYGGNDAYPTPWVGCAFHNAPRGYCPEMDEDDGAMSAWYVFASIGLYPVVVGEAAYEVFSPLYDKITLRLGDSVVNIKTVGRSHADQPLKRIKWNGKKLREPRISHAMLKEGGELLLQY